MMSKGRIYESLEKYKQDNYYLDKDKSLNTETIQTAGTGWQAVGYDGREITGSDFTNLTKGKDLNGNLLSDSFGNQKHRGGYDMTWSPDKSVTMLAFQSKDNLEKVSSIMMDVAKDTVSFAEKQGFIQYRQSINGEVVSKTTDNATALINLHLTGRQDPQIHAHMAFFNFTSDDDGKYRALNSDSLFMNRFTIEAYAENNLANRIQKEFGSQIEFVKTGKSAEYTTKIKGLDETVWGGIARTTKAIDDYIDKHKDELKAKYPEATEAQIKKKVYLQIRNSKQSKTLEQVFSDIDKGLAEAGLTRDDVAGILAKNKIDNSIQNKLSADEIAHNAITELENKKSSFTAAELTKTALQMSGGLHNSDDILKAVDRAKDRLVSLDKYQIQTAKTAYEAEIITTKEIVTAQNNIVRTVERGQNAVEAINKNDYHNDKLTKAQNNTINFILKSQDRISAVNGWAGTGKTTFLTELKKEVEKAGYTIVGTSTTNTAVGEMRAKDIDALTTTRLNLNEGNTKLNDKSILVIDESSFLSTKEFDKVLKKVSESGARAVIIGDTNQLQGVSAGSPFSLLIKNDIVKSVELNDIVRQKNETLKSGVYDLYRDNIAEAFDKIEIKEIKDKDEAIKAIANDYIDKGYKDTLIATATNADKDAINKKVRDSLFKDKESIEITTYDRKKIDGIERYKGDSYAVGDRISLLGDGRTGDIKEINGNIIKVEFADKTTKDIDVSRQANNISVYEKKTIQVATGEKIITTGNIKTGQDRILNSSVGYITAIDKTNKTFTIETADNKKFVSNADNKNNLFTYGYAMTSDRSQGKTVKNVIVYETRNFENTLVSNTRATDTAVVYTNDKESFIQKSGIKSVESRVAEMQYSKTKGMEFKKEAEYNNKITEPQFKNNTVSSVELDNIVRQKDDVIADINKNPYSNKVTNLTNGEIQKSSSNGKLELVSLTTIANRQDIVKPEGIQWMKSGAKFHISKGGGIKQTNSGLAFFSTTSNLTNTKAVETGKVLNKDVKWRTEKKYSTTMFGRRKIDVFSATKANDTIYINKGEYKKGLFGKYKQTGGDSYKVDIKEIKEQLAEYKQKYGDLKEIKQAEKSLNKFSKKLDERSFRKLQDKTLALNVKIVKERHKDLDEAVEKSRKEQSKEQERLAKLSR